MKRLLSAISFVLLALATVSPAYATIGVIVGPAHPYSGAQLTGLCSSPVGTSPPIPCSPYQGDSYFEAVPTNTLTKIIPGVAGQFTRFTYIGYNYIDSATGGAVLYREGTGTNCGTNTVTFWSGPWDVATTEVTGEFGANRQGEIAQTLVAGDDVCFSLAGTITSAFTFGTFLYTP
jgi:hypothetical protein